MNDDLLPVPTPSDEPSQLKLLIERCGKLPLTNGRVAIPESDLQELVSHITRITEANIAAMEYRRGGPIDIKLEPPPWFHAMLVIHLGRMLVGKDGKPVMNYVSQKAFHQDFGDVEVIVQRCNRNTPADQLREAEAIMRRILESPSADNRERHLQAAQEFLDRPRTET